MSAGDTCSRHHQQSYAEESARQAIPVQVAIEPTQQATAQHDVSLVCGADWHRLPLCSPGPHLNLRLLHSVIRVHTCMLHLKCRVHQIAQESHQPASGPTMKYARACNTKCYGPVIRPKQSTFQRCGTHADQWCALQAQEFVPPDQPAKQLQSSGHCSLGSCWVALECCQRVVCQLA